MTNSRKGLRTHYLVHKDDPISPSVSYNSLPWLLDDSERQDSDVVDIEKRYDHDIGTVVSSRRTTVGELRRVRDVQRGKVEARNRMYPD